MQKGDNCTEAAKQQIFRFNPGKELQLFPPKHPYFKGPKTEQLKQSIDGYTPAEWTPKTIAEAEQFYQIRRKLFTERLYVKANGAN